MAINPLAVNVCMCGPFETSGFNPIWLVVIINAIALIAVPFFTYMYSHVVSLKSMKERWISELRNTAADALEVSEEIYRSSERLYAARATDDRTSEESARLERSSAYSRYSALRGKTHLLFKEDDKTSAHVNSLLNELQEAAENHETDAEGVTTMDRVIKDNANEKFLKDLNEILYQEWQDVQKFTFWAYVKGRRSV